jgi:hypothetical protein
MTTENATDILKSWLSVGDRLAGILDAMDAARALAGDPRRVATLAAACAECYLIRGLAEEIPQWDAYQVAMHAVGQADTIELIAWARSLRYERCPDPVAAIIEEWHPVGNG